MKNALFIFIVLFFTTKLMAQVAINTTGGAPNSKAVLDVSSSTMGMLVPRMTTAQRNTLEATLTPDEKGMMVFDSVTNTFYYFNGTVFDSISSGAISLLQDTDGDTKVLVEETPDNDQIRFETGGLFSHAIKGGKIEVYNTGGSIYIGDDAGKIDDWTYNDHNNIGIGNSTLKTSMLGKNNVAIGLEAMMNGFEHDDNNIAIGTRSLYSNRDGAFNIAIGVAALYSYKLDGVIAIGDSSLYHNGSGTISGDEAQKNTAIGTKTLFLNTTGHNNTAVGFEVLTNNNGTGNSALASYALRNNTTGIDNTAVGYKSLFNNSSGSNNVAIGAHSLASNTVIDDLVAIGDSALCNNGIGASGTNPGKYNTAIGSNTLHSNTTGFSNTALGYKTLYSNVAGGNNCGVGTSTLFSNSGGSYNTAIGSEVLYSNVSGKHNTAAGYHALYSNTGEENSAFGSQALKDNTSGANNTAMGKDALQLNTSGRDNTAIGYTAMIGNQIGSENTAVGVHALGFYGGDYNTAVGYHALRSSTGGGNIALGHSAGDNLTTGNGNIIIGYDIDAPSATGNDKLNIGNLIYANNVNGSGTTYSTGNVGIGTNNPTSKLDVRGSSVQLKNSSGNVKLYLDGTSGNSEIEFQKSNGYLAAIGYNMTSNYLYMYEGGNVVLKGGNLGVGTLTPGYRLQVGNSGDGSTARANAWNTFSDRKLKKDIVEIENPSEKLEHLNGYYYYWKEGSDKTRQVGVIAQEVEEVLPEIVSTDAEGIKSLDYSKLTPLLIEVLKEQQEIIKKLEARIDALEKE
jgi:hypothetical protein